MTNCLELAPQYTVVQCSVCGGIQISQSKHRLRCVYCGKSRVFRSKGLWNVKVYGMYSKEQDASDRINEVQVSRHIESKVGV